MIRALFAEPAAVLGTAVTRMIAVLIGLCCHEWGHAYVAHLWGDATARRAGRMTLNPLAHLDPVGTLLMLFAGFGFAKPVPVNPYNFRNRLRGDLCVSLAGVTVNIALFVFFTYLTALLSRALWVRELQQSVGLWKLISFEYNAVWTIIDGTAGAQYAELFARASLLPIVRICAYASLTNLSLAVFNLIPIPPLDGYHVVNDLIFRGRIHLSPRAFQIAMLLVLFLSWRGILGRVIFAVVFPAQRLLLLPLGAS